MSAVLEIADLRVSLPVDGQYREALHGVSLTVAAGEAVAVVGESGSGKSMMARAVIRVLPNGSRVGGAVRFKDEDVYQMNGRRLSAFRSTGIAMIFQDPRAHINPVRSIGDFLTEVLITKQGVKPVDARRKVLRLLREVDVSRPEDRLHQYPHELSGGLLQRVMIAAALAIEPKVILADEPTTALDVTTQSELMCILDERRQADDLALLLITHDLDLSAAVCDRTAVMYAGRIMEEGSSRSLHDQPRHPYTAALAASRPQIANNGRRLSVIQGQPLSAIEAPLGCPFVPRCKYAIAACRASEPLPKVIDGGLSACIRTNDIRAQLRSEGQPA